MAELSLEKRLDVCQKSLWMIIARMLHAIDDKYGDEGMDVVYRSLRDWDVHKANIERYGLTPGTLTPMELAEIVFNPTDEIAFTMKEKPVISQDPETGQVLYKARDCNVAKLIGQECPKICAVVSRGIEDGLAQAANPRIKVSGEQWLSTGHDGCYIYLDLEE